MTPPSQRRPPRDTPRPMPDARDQGGCPLPCDNRAPLRSAQRHRTFRSGGVRGTPAERVPEVSAQQRRRVWQVVGVVLALLLLAACDGSVDRPTASATRTLPTPTPTVALPTARPTPTITPPTAPTPRPTPSATVPAVP